jgi:uncharacterized protein (TIGR03067 family)
MLTTDRPREAGPFGARNRTWRDFNMIPSRASLCLLGLLVLGLHTGTCADDDAAERELKRHQGVWIATSSTFDGQSVPENVVRSIRRIVVDDHVVWERNGKRFAGTKFVFDSTKEPKTIDVIPDGGRNRGEHILGIYKLERESITICMAAPGQPRPKEFKAEKGNGCTLQIFAREKETSIPKAEQTRSPAHVMHSAHSSDVAKPGI